MSVPNGAPFVSLLHARGRGGVGAALSLALFAGVILDGPRAYAADPAQKVARLAYVDPYSPSSTPVATSAFWARLQELGWVRGQNLIVETRWAEGRIDRLPALMAEVVANKVDVIVTRGTPATIAAKNATSTIPVVFASMGDPVGSGVATSLAKPGGNLTGLSSESSDLGGKWLEILQEAVPRLSAVAVVSNPDSAYVRNIRKRLESAAKTRGLKLLFVEVRELGALPAAFQQARRQAQAALVLADPLMFSQPEKVTKLAARNGLPAVYTFRAFADSGGLITYGADTTTLFQRAAHYVDKILRGAKPAELPIEQPTQFKLIVNLKAAKALGLTFPESILLRADEVIR